MNILIIDDVNPKNGKWFAWCKTDNSADDYWSGYISSVPEGVYKSSKAGYPVGHWMRLSNKIVMSAEPCSGSQQQLDKSNQLSD